MSEPKVPVLNGDVFGLLVVIDANSCMSTHCKKPLRMSTCKCECGTIKNILNSSLKSGKSRSCGGCLQQKHGYSGTLTANSWHSMIHRCTNPSDPKYALYGGRGIKIHPEWLNFKNFLQDMGERKEGYSLDRIDVDGNYEPGNCRWATREEQDNNRRDTVRILYLGKEQSLKQWATELGLNYDSLRYRIVRNGWNIEKAFTTPFSLNNPRKR